MEKSLENKTPLKFLTAKKLIERYLTPIGIKINGNNPWDITVHNTDLYGRVLKEGSLGLGESYMDKWWDCARLDIFFDKILRAKLDTHVSSFQFKLKEWLANIINLQSKSRATEVAQVHYDLGNTLFHAMLDERMIYSCAYWKKASTLDDAQIAKLDLICQKLELKPGLTLLDIGCGWGGLAKFAAENYGVKVTGLTISKQQYDYAKTYCQNLPINILLKDYRDIDEQYDRIVSVGMFEHVGHTNYSTYMNIVHRSLKNKGLFLLHTIGANEASPVGNEWIAKYIFPNGALPSLKLIDEASEPYFITEDLQNFGAYYDQTLMAWYENFKNHWPELKSSYDERFYRMWTYYLLSCAGSFRARSNQLWQFVFSKEGVDGVYIAPR